MNFQNSKVLEERTASLKFDKYRKIRNSINYYGKIISINEAKNVLDRIKKLRREIIKIL